MPNNVVGVLVNPITGKLSNNSDSKSIYWSEFERSSYVSDISISSSTFFFSNFAPVNK
jgi:hypothetical protein